MAEPWAADPWIQAAAVVGGALLGGLTVSFARRYVIAVITALIGSLVIVSAMQTDFPLLVGTLIFVVSAIFQTGLARRFVSDDAVDRAWGRKRKG